MSCEQFHVWTLVGPGGRDLRAPKLVGLQAKLNAETAWLFR